MMRFRHAIFAMLVAALMSMPFMANAAEQGKEATLAQAECTTDKARVPTCKRASTAAEPTGTTKKRKACVFTCRKSHGIWVCKGNGSQCDGQSPWN